MSSQLSDSNGPPRGKVVGKITTWSIFCASSLILNNQLHIFTVTDWWHWGFMVRRRSFVCSVFYIFDNVCQPLKLSEGAHWGLLRASTHTLCTHSSVFCFFVHSLLKPLPTFGAEMSNALSGDCIRREKRMVSCEGTGILVDHVMRRQRWINPCCCDNLWE